MPNSLQSGLLQILLLYLSVIDSNFKEIIWNYLKTRVLVTEAKLIALLQTAKTHFKAS